ncbi:MAG: TlpA disulfide reductase family protein [Thermodesulfobacteriota bacterium]|nr:TlpA disulfide reductase family protein [Desulfovibrionales bacterium]MDQ7838591.1 TlpA disulfide reductase family protein [Thermodesulfobacteriota bacterium]
MTDNASHYLRHSIRWSVALAFILLVFAGLYTAHDSEAKPIKAADFSLKDLDGRMVSLSHFKGKVVLVNFWATGCPACRAEIPGFIAIHKKYKGKGFEIISISLDDATTSAGKKILAEFIKRAGITYPVLIGTNAVCKDYGGIYYIPVSFLVDSKGNIIKRYIGELKMDVLEKDMAPLLKR